MFAVECSHAYNLGKEEIIFIREYREYGWKEYGADSIKFPHPIQTLIGFYLVEYRLDATRLTITKMPTTPAVVPSILFTTILNRAQQQAMQQAMHTTIPDLIQQQCDAVMVDDGFHLNVTLTKAGANRSFLWNVNYVYELLEFLDIINKISPEKYKFYRAQDKKIFRQRLEAQNK
ncbi:hypothetical protein GCM10027422_20550 [Hymenobacter arcticus]